MPIFTKSSLCRDEFYNNSFHPSPPGEGLLPFEYQSATQAFLQSSLDIFTPNNIEKKRKKRSCPMYTPEDRFNSMFNQIYVLPSRDNQLKRVFLMKTQPLM